MPYVKRYRNKRRFGLRLKSMASAPKAYRSLTKKIKRITPGVDSWDHALLNNASINTTTGSITSLLNDLPQGTAAGHRNSQQIQVSSIHLRGQVTLYESANAVGSIRVMVFQDKWNNSTAPTINDVFDDDVGSIASSYCTAQINKDFQKRYKVMYDKNIVTVAGQSNTRVQMNIYRKFYNYRVEYDGSDVALNHQMYLLVVSDTAPGGGPPATTGHFVDLVSRINFRDI